MRSILFSTVSCLLFVFVSVSAGSDGVWQKIDNPYKMGTIEGLSIGYDATETQNIFAATSSDDCALWQSTDQGLNWVPRNRIDGHVHTRVVIEAGNFNCGWTLVPSNAGNTDPVAGPWRSVNRGVYWEQRTTPILENAKKLHALAANPKSTNPNLMTAYIGGAGNADNGYKKLFKTSDGGMNWQLAQSGLPEGEEGTVHDIAICEGQPQYMYCAYSTETGNPNNNGIYRSTNGGDSWTHLAFNGTASASAVAVHPDAPNVVVATEKAPQSGRTWLLKDNQWHDISSLDIYYHPLMNMDNVKLISWDKVLKLNLKQ